MSFVAVAAVAVVGGAIYMGNQQDKAIKAQKREMEKAREEDKRQAAAAEVDAQVAANEATAAAKRRRRGNALQLGDGSGQTLGGTSVLGAGAATPVAAGKPASTVLSSGAR